MESGVSPLLRPYLSLLLAVPVSTAEIEELRQMVKEVNDNEVAPEEILGYEVYRYNRETGEVEVAV